MVAVLSFLRRRFVMNGHFKVQLLPWHWLSTRIHEQLYFRLAKSSDFDEVVKLSKGCYNGYDYLPVVFLEWLKSESVAMILMYAGRNLIGLEASFIVDNGKTFVRRAGRIAPHLRGKGLARNLGLATNEYVRANFPKVSRERIVTTVELENPYHRILEYEKLAFLVKEPPGIFDRRVYSTRNLSTTVKECQLESCTNEYVSNVILSPLVMAKFFPNNVFMFCSCPFEPLQSNIPLILKEGNGLHWYVEKCSGEACPRSISYGVHAQRENTKIWEATVYSDDPAIVGAHLLHHLKRAGEIIKDDFTCFTVQDKTMTDCVRGVLHETLQLKEVKSIYGTSRFLYARLVAG